MNKTKKIMAIVLGSFTGLIVGSRLVGHQLTKWVGNIAMTDPYDQNIGELFSASTRTGAQNIFETNLRAEAGSVIQRPLGSPRRFFDFNGVAFSPVYLTPRLPTPGNIRINTETIIGKHCKKPMVLATPILISGMAYGFALSEQAKYALAKGSAIANTATNTGEGAWLQQERDLAKNLILQYNRGSWNKQPEILKQADMIEIQLGQGAIAGISHINKSNTIDKKLRQRLGLSPGKHAVIEARHRFLDEPDGLRKTVAQLKTITGGVPIGIKLSFTNTVEREIEIALDAGIDVLAFEGSQAATKGAPPILEDDFGLPTIMGLCRCVQHLEKLKARDQVSLIVGGGLYNPGDFLKAIALGADAVYIGSTALFAMAHTQVLKALPWEPPTQIVWNSGKYKDKFNWKTGAKSVAKFINSCTLEMDEGIRALGKTSLNQVNRSDIIALDQQTHLVTGLPLAWKNPTIPKGRQRHRRRMDRD